MPGSFDQSEVKLITEEEYETEIVGNQIYVWGGIFLNIYTFNLQMTAKVSLD